MDYEKEFVIPALQATEKWHHVLPSDVQRALRVALSVIQTHGSATVDELRRELGENWVIARRTPAIVARYGEDVRCYSQAQYRDAERRAILKRGDVETKDE